MIPQAQIVFGLGNGDEGKGTMVDFLCRLNQASLVVRYSGGSQAAHNVVTDEGAHHTFSQIGSGSFVPGVRTLISRFMLWDPISLAYEAAALSPKLGHYALKDHFIDERSPVITPFHAAANRLKEWARGRARHGSCGKGVGETAFDLIHHPAEVILAGQLENPATTVSKLRLIQVRKQQELKAFGVTKAASLPASLSEAHSLLFEAHHPDQIASTYRDLARMYQVIPAAETIRLIQGSVSVFEGSQGVLIDEWHGFHPYTTWSTVTPRNAFALLKECGIREGIKVTGVIRAYGTRHGAGPFVTELPDFDRIHPGEHNRLDDWQGQFRFGGFDGVMLRYAAECVRPFGLDSIAVTHLDALDRVSEIPVCDEYLDPEGSVIRRLSPSFGEDLAYQEKLSQRLFEARSSATGSFRSVGDVIRYVEANAEVPVMYLSHGPRACDKSLSNA